MRALSVALLVSSFALVAIIQSWPLPLHLGAAVTGQVGGDTGVYLWNLWVFRSELLAGQFPFTTDSIFVPVGQANLSLHNYTVAADLLGTPLQSFVSVVTTFNLIYLANVTLAGVGGFLLARRALRSQEVDTPSAWIAGLLYACSPFLVARSTAHFSLVAAAALPFFIVALDRAWHGGRQRDAVLVGLTFAWAAYSDPYYGIYALLLGAAWIAAQLCTVHLTSREPSRAARVTDSAIGVAAVLVLVIVFNRAGLLPPTVSALAPGSLYNPVLVLSFFVALRAWHRYRPAAIRTGALPRGWLTQGLTAGLTAGVCLAPVLLALVSRFRETGVEQAPVFWRSSAPGVDLLSFLSPNPNHALAPDALVNWFARQPGWFEENVVAIPLTAIAVIILTWLRTKRCPTPFWAAVALGSAWLALGPFVRVAGIDTYVPTPWTFLRYVPGIGEARMPARFGVLVAMGASVLLAAALTTLRRRSSHRGRLTIAIGVLLALELAPVPRRLFPAAVPSVYTRIASDPRPISVMDLPTGWLDGLSGRGRYSALSQFHQTVHGKPIIGGYLSRVRARLKVVFETDPVLKVLADASEGLPVPLEAVEAAQRHALRFVSDTALGYVVIDEGRSSEELKALAKSVLGLREVDRHGGFGLYEPTITPLDDGTEEGAGVRESDEEPQNPSG